MAGSYISIPTILKVGKNTLDHLGAYLETSGLKMQLSTLETDLSACSVIKYLILLKKNILPF